MRMRIFFKVPDDFIGNAINFFEKIKSGKSNVCHCGWIIDEDAYESLFIGGMTKRNFELAYKNKKTIIFEVTDKAVTPEGKQLIYEFLEGLLGNSKGIYGFTKIPLQAIDAVLSFIARKPVFFATRLHITKSFICSGSVSYPLYKWSVNMIAGLFKNWRGLSPDDIYDIAIQNPESFIEKES